MANKRPADETWSNDRPPKKDIRRPASTFGGDTFRPAAPISRSDDRAEGDSSGPVSRRATPSNETTSRIPLINGPSPALPPPSITNSQSQDPRHLFAALIALAGEVAIARLAENAAERKVAKCEVDRNKAANVHAYPTFLEVRNAALLRHEADLAEKQKAVAHLLGCQAILARQYNEALSSSTSTAHNDLSAKISAAMEARVKPLLDSKDQEISALKRRIDQMEADSRVAGHKHSASLDVLQKTVGDRVTDLEKVVKIKLDKQQDDVDTIRGDVKRAQDMFHMADQKMSSYATKKNLEDISVPLVANLAVLTTQSQNLSADSEKLAVTQREFEQVPTDLKNLTEEVKKLSARVSALPDTQQDPSLRFGQEIRTLNEAVNNLYNELGEEGKDYGLTNSVITLEDRLNRLDQQLKSLVVTQKNQQTTEAVPRNHEKDNILIDALQIKIKALSESFSVRFQQLNDGLGERVEEEIEAYVKDFEENLRIEITDLKQKSEQQNQAITGVPQYINGLENRVGEVETRLGTAEEHLRKQRDISNTPKPDANPDKAQVKELIWSGIEANFQTNVKPRLEVLEEASRFLHERYNNTTTDEVVQAMCAQFRNRIPPDPNQIRINTGVNNEIAKLQSEFRKLSEIPGRLQSVQASQQNLQERHANLSVLSQKLKKDFDERQTMVEELNKIVKQPTAAPPINLDPMQNNINALMEEINQLNREQGDTLKRLEDVDATIERLDSDLGAMKSSRVLEQEEYRRKREDLERGFVDLKGLCERLQAEGATKIDIESFRATSQKLDDLKKKLEKLEQLERRPLFNGAKMSINTTTSNSASSTSLVPSPALESALPPTVPQAATQQTPTSRLHSNPAPSTSKFRNFLKPSQNLTRQSTPPTSAPPSRGKPMHSLAPTPPLATSPKRRGRPPRNPMASHTLRNSVQHKASPQSSAPADCFSSGSLSPSSEGEEDDEDDDDDDDDEDGADAERSIRRGTSEEL